MSADGRLNIYLTEIEMSVVERLAHKRGLTKSALVRRAIGTLQALEDAVEAGQVVGATRDREALDTLIIAP